MTLTNLSKKEYIITNVNKLPIKYKHDILYVLKINDAYDLVKDGGNQCYINLDLLDNCIIEQLYNYIKSKNVILDAEII
jgi:hypothetical protein